MSKVIVVGEMCDWLIFNGSIDETVNENEEETTSESQSNMSNDLLID